MTGTSGPAGAATTWREEPVSAGWITAHSLAQAGDQIWASAFTITPADLEALMLHRVHGEWTSVAVPDIGRLGQVSAGSADDVWALSRDSTKLLHFTGSSWQVVQPTTDASVFYSGITQFGTDVWLAGSRRASDRTFVVLAAKAFGRDDVWMAGTAGSAEDGPNHPFAAVFDGHRWTEQKIDGDAARLTGVTRSGNRVLVVGYRLTSPSSPFGATETAGTNTWPAAALPATPAGSPGYHLSGALTLRDRSVLLLGNADKPDSDPHGDVTWRPYAANGRF